MERMRRYRLAADLGITPSAQDEESAVELDWLLKIHEAVINRQNRESDAHA